MRHLSPVLKPLSGDDWGFCVFCAQPLNPLQTNFLFITKLFMERPRISSKRDSWLKQNTWKFCTKPLLMVYEIEWVYLLLCQRPICKTGSNDVYFKGSWCPMRFERIFKRCKYMWLELSSHPRSRILQFSCWNQAVLLEGVTPCKERDDPRYAWENITFFPDQDGNWHRCGRVR